MLSSMIVFALDTTSRPGSLAVRRDGRLVATRIGDATRTPGERLPGEIVALLDECGLRVRDVDVFAAAAGPGSFTGLRVGIATIQGLALVARRPAAGVSGLDALAYLVRPRAGTRLIAPWIDAQRREVFAALYRPLAESEPAPSQPSLGFVERLAPVVSTAERLLESWHATVAGVSVLFVGDGARAYRSLIMDRHGRGAEVIGEVGPIAPAIAEIAELRAAAGVTLDPHAIVPVYIRRPDAELARDKRGQ